MLKPNFSAARYRRLTSSCMSAALEAIFLVAPLAAMLSVSINTVLPRKRSPPVSHTLRMPSSSRQLMGRRFSAAVKRTTDSSRAPSSQSTWPVPQPLASVPVTTASPIGFSLSKGAKLREWRWSSHQSKSRQKPSVTSSSCQAPPTGATVPRRQSTTRPLNCESMPCI